MKNKNVSYNNDTECLPEILFITSYPPRECGIATYSQDLINVIDTKFGQSFSIKVCALETNNESYSYNDRVNYVLDTPNPSAYLDLAYKSMETEKSKL